MLCMKHQKKYLLFYLSALYLLMSCSTSKNTGFSRGYNSFTTRYNIYFNGYQSYKEGINAINLQQKDNYSQLLPMYPISHHANASAGSAKMQTTIEKCRKAIKLKSIKAKPKRNFAKRKDPDYIAFMNKEEYNPMVVRSWLLLAQAEFHKGDFLGAMGTYAYIIRHLGNDPDVDSEAEIGRARCFAEMGWLYEAEDALNKVNTKNQLKKRINGMYAAAQADLLIKEKRYADAIPFLKAAAKDESNRFYKARFNFILGQLCTRYNNRETAFLAYGEAIKLSTSYEMELAARLQQAQVTGKQQDKLLAGLEKMAKQPKNKDYSDRIHVVIANIYLNNNNRKKAIEHYTLAIKSSNQDNPDKMTANICLGDLFYAEKNYLKAQPFYAAAAKQIKADNDDFERVSKRADVLNELALYDSNIHTQDSIQTLSKLPKEQKTTYINKYIDHLKKIEYEASLAQRKEEQQQILRQQELIKQGFSSFGGNTPQGQTASTFTGSASTANWYFYNPTTVQNGVAYFQQTWGSRKLEDDWRRKDKSSISDDLQAASQANSTVNETSQKQDAPAKASDKYDPDFYLAQLFSSTEDFSKSDGIISKSLFNMGQLYEKKLDEIPLAIATYEELYNRFGTDSTWIDAYYSLYTLYTKTGNTAAADKYKALITSKYPTSRYALILGYPDYARHQYAITQFQDSLYEATFMAYTKNDFQAVKNNYSQINSQYPFASLMPRFAMLNALSTGKMGNQPEMKAELDALVKKYPQSEVTSTVKNMLALLEQGKTVTKGASYNNLTTQRQEQTQEEAKANTQTLPSFTSTLNSRHFVLLTVRSDSMNIHQLLYKIARYNFSNYVLKDFDLDIRYLPHGVRAIAISDFSSFEDARYYMSSFSNDATLTKEFAATATKPVVISEDNLKAIIAGQTFDDYLVFYQNTLIPAQMAASKQQ